MEKIVILDFGSQVTQLIARRLRAMRYNAEILPFDTSLDILSDKEIKGIIFSGGPSSVYSEGAPHVSKKIFELNKPILGICYGLQEIVFQMGGKVVRGDKREYGFTKIMHSEKRAGIFLGTPGEQTVWMSHGDAVTKVPKEFSVEAISQNSPYASISNEDKKIYGVQFHVEVSHTKFGVKMLDNFAKICKLHKQWTTQKAVEYAIEQIRLAVPKNSVVVNGISGGVDSTVLALLLKQALPSRQIKNIFIDNGLLRLNEAKDVISVFKKLKIKINFVDASQRFLKEIRGVMDPEFKRKIVGRVFVEEFMKHIGPKDFLSQGTLYPDVIESVKVHGPSDTIKTHHNRAPEVLELIKDRRVIEPLKELFKDEVRELGKTLGLPENVVWRHPFPGPGLGIRILGEVTDEKLKMLRHADSIFIEEIRKSGDYKKIAQALAVLDESRAVGVKGDEREYGNIIILRAVTTSDFMTADWYPFDHDLLSRISTRIINEVKGVTRVLYDISQKPPATIEFL